MLPPDLFQDRQSAATQQQMTNRHTRPKTVRDLVKSLSGTYRNHCPGLTETRNQLSSDSAQIAHAWLSSWINAGASSRISIDKLIGKVWGEADVSASTLRKRRWTLRQALDELRGLAGWQVDEDERGILHISRPSMINSSSSGVTDTPTSK